MPNTEPETRNGWLTPEGGFFPAEESPPVSMAGLELGGHARAALDWLREHRPDLLGALYFLRQERGFMTWEEQGAEKLIKDFMARHGFTRIAPE